MESPASGKVAPRVDCCVGANHVGASTEVFISGQSLSTWAFVNPPILDLSFGHASRICFSGKPRFPFLEALMVALSQTHDQESWYTSTKELQLASLQCCHACRSVTTLALVVDDSVPCRLLAAADPPPPNRKRPCSSRVPRLRVRGVLWDSPSAAELTRSIYAVADATEMRFGRKLMKAWTASNGRVD